MKGKSLDFAIINREVMKGKKEVTKGIYDILLLVGLMTVHELT